MSAEGATSTLERLRTFSKTRNVELRDAIIEEHLPLVSQLARRFANRGEPLEDLVQVASIALMKAVDRFDPDLGFEFEAYATTTIIGELKRHFRDCGWTIRAPRAVQELYLNLGTVLGELSQRLGRSPTVRELARETGASEERVLEALEAGNAYRSESIDMVGADGEPLAARLRADDTNLDRAEDRMFLEPRLAQLPPREQTILALRFIEELTQSEIAARVGMSQMHVSRLLARSLALLHEAVEEET
jgi:RNA polymerase sigma-B factor